VPWKNLKFFGLSIVLAEKSGYYCATVEKWRVERLALRVANNLILSPFPFRRRATCRNPVEI